MRPRFKLGHWCFLEAACENTWWNRNLNENKRQLDVAALQMIDTHKCRTSPPKIPATEPLSLGQRKGGRNYKFQGSFENKKTLIKTTMASNLWCIHSRICQRRETENQVLAPRRAESEEHIDLDPEQLTSIAQHSSKCHKFEAIPC